MPIVNGHYVPTSYGGRTPGLVSSNDPIPARWSRYFQQHGRSPIHALGAGGGGAASKRPPGVVPGISEYFPPSGYSPGGLADISEYFPPGSKGPIPGHAWGPPHEMPPVGGPRYPRAPGGAHTPGMPPPVYDGNGSWPRRPPAGHGMPPTGGPRYATKAQRILNIQVPGQQGSVPFGGEPYPRKIHVARGAAARRRKGMARKMLRYHGRMAMKAELQRLAGFLPAAVKSVDPWAIDQWTASMQQGVGSREEAVEALGDLLQAGVPEESYAEVSAAIGEMLAGLEEDEAADAAGAYDQEDALYEGGDDDGGPEAYYGDDDDGTVEYRYAGDDGMGEFKAISPAEEFEDAAQALASRSLEILSAQPAIKSVGFQAPYFHTHAPHGDRLAHLKAFDQFIRLGETRMDRMLFEHLQGATKAAMQEDTDSEGGYLLPDEFSKDLIKALYNESWVRQTDYRRITMSHKTLEVPTVVASTRATRSAEEGPVTQKEPTTGVVTFTATTVSQMSKVSRELLADSRFPVWEQVLLPDYKQAFAEGENTDFTVGTGSGEPQGCLAGATLGVTTASPSAFTADEVKGLYNALNHKYRGLPSVCWMMADATMGLIRLLKDGQGRYLINGDLSKGEPETLLGKPVIINNGMPAATTGLKPILFGAFNYFGIADRQDMRMQRLEELYAVNRQVGFLADMRNDSRVLLAVAFQYLAMA